MLHLTDLTVFRGSSHLLDFPLTKRIKLGHSNLAVPCTGQSVRPGTSPAPGLSGESHLVQVVPQVQVGLRHSLTCFLRSTCSMDDSTGWIWGHVPQSKKISGSFRTSMSQFTEGE